MAKCLVGANGGGKVTVEGLTAETVLSGTTVTVKQGAKELLNIMGALDVLAVVGRLNNGGGMYWNGTKYIVGEDSVVARPFTFSGTPIFAVAAQTRNERPYSLCGVTVNWGTTPKVLTKEKLVNNSYSPDTYSGNGVFVVLGIK